MWKSSPRREISSNISQSQAAVPRVSLRQEHWILDGDSHHKCRYYANRKPMSSVTVQLSASHKKLGILHLW